MRGDITVITAPKLQVAFKNCASFITCITKIDGTTIDDAEDLDLVMPMYNLTEYISNYCETTGSLSFYSKDEASNFNDNIANTDIFKSFKYKAKAKLLGNTVADGADVFVRDTTIALLSKCLSNFWRSLEMLLINFKVELEVKWGKYCVLPAAGNRNDSNKII